MHGKRSATQGPVAEHIAFPGYRLPTSWGIDSRHMTTITADTENIRCTVCSPIFQENVNKISLSVFLKLLTVHLFTWK